MKKKEVVDVQLEIFTRQDTADSWHTHVCAKGKGELVLPDWAPQGRDSDKWLQFHGDCLGYHYSLTRIGNATIGKWMALYKAKKELRRRMTPPQQRTTSKKESITVRMVKP